MTTEHGVIENTRRVTSSEIEDAIDYVLRACAEQEINPFGTRTIRNGWAVALSHPDFLLFSDVEDPIRMALRKEMNILGQFLYDKLKDEGSSQSLLDRAYVIAEQHGDSDWRMHIMNYAFHGVGADGDMWLA